MLGPPPPVVSGQTHHRRYCRHRFVTSGLFIIQAGFVEETCSWSLEHLLTLLRLIDSGRGEGRGQGGGHDPPSPPSPVPPQPGLPGPCSKITKTGDKLVPTEWASAWASCGHPGASCLILGASCLLGLCATIVKHIKTAHSVSDRITLL